MAKVSNTRNKAGKPDAIKMNARTGETTLAAIETAIQRIGECQSDLKAFASWMKESKTNSLTIDGPGLLPRGVNSVLQYVKKMDSAIKDKRRMQ